MKNEFKKEVAFSQVFLLVVSIIAFTYAIGSEVGTVSGLGVINCQKGIPVELCYIIHQDNLKKQNFTVEKFRDFARTNNYLDSSGKIFVKDGKENKNCRHSY